MGVKHFIILVSNSLKNSSSITETLSVWLNSTKENSQSQQIPELQELLGEPGSAHSCLQQLTHEKQELFLVHDSKGMEEKRYSASVIPSPCSLAGELPCNWFTESVIALLMLISMLGCSLENPAHAGSKITDKITHIQLPGKALQGNNLRHAFRRVLYYRDSCGPFQPAQPN